MYFLHESALFLTDKMRFLLLLQWITLIIVCSWKARISLAVQDELCGTTSFSNTSGVIRYPPSGVYSNIRSIVDCAYSIAVGEANTISIQFLYSGFHLSRTTCPDNWMRILCSRDGTADTIVSRNDEICLNSRWNSVLKLSDCPVLTVVYHSFSAFRWIAGTFQLQYDIEPRAATNETAVDDLPEIDCGQTLFTVRSGDIILPHNANISRAKINCTYTITATRSLDWDWLQLRRSISLEISELDLLTLSESVNLCLQDDLQFICTNDVGNKSSVLDCNRFVNVFPGCYKLEIILRSDSYSPKVSRQISYYRIPGDSESEIEEDEEIDEDSWNFNFDRNSHVGCGNTSFSGQSGIVTSPRFPLSHPHDLNCIYNITVGQNNIVSLKILNFHLEDPGANADCPYDWLKISCLSNEANNMNSPTLRKFCGSITWTHELRYSNCSNLLLHFFSDSSVAEGGFAIRYSVTANDPSTALDNAVACGRTDFRESSGNITLPSNPTAYFMAINCTYNIYATSDSIISLNLTALNMSKIISSFRSCTHERFQIACSDGSNQWNLNFCTNWLQSLKPAVLKCRRAQLLLSSKYYDIEDIDQIPFKVTALDTVCGNAYFTASEGVILSPNSPFPYPPEVNCTYTVVVGNDASISLKFQFFDMGGSLNINGCEDWMMMTCSQSINQSPYANRRFCGRLNFPSVVQFSNCTTLQLTFSSSRTATSSNGFSLNYTVSALGTPEISAEPLPEIACGRYLHSDDVGSIYLPSDVNLPVAALNCTYVIAMPDTFNKGSILFNFREMVTSYDELVDCSKSLLTINCASNKTTAEMNSASSVKKCWNEMRQASVNFTFTNCNSIQLSLFASVYIPHGMRRLSYAITTNDCGETSFTSLSGNITSPRFPSPYPHKAHCIYNIDVGLNKTISFQSLTFDLEGGRLSNCPHDWLTIHCASSDGRADESPVRFPAINLDYDPYELFYRRESLSHLRRFVDRRLCGFDSIRTTLRNCQTVRLEFSTDSSVNGRGFNIQYKIGDGVQHSNYTCGNQTFAESSGIITSPNFNDETNCTYMINAGRNRSVAVEVLAFDIETFSDFRRYEPVCSDSWLLISCLSGSNSAFNPLEGRKICRGPYRKTKMHGCDFVSVNFYSSRGGSFKVDYKIWESDEDECGGKIFSNETGIIASPDFPSTYPPNLNCTYRINVGINNTLSLTFLKFDLEGRNPYPSYRFSSTDILCLHDWVEVKCLSENLHNDFLGKKMCGYKSPFKSVITRCQQIGLLFVTDDSVSREGFQIQYSIYEAGKDECGNKIFSNLTGTITSPNYPSNYEDHLNCTYFIEAPGNGYSIALQFLAFDLEINGFNSERRASVSDVFRYCNSDWVQIRCESGETIAPTDFMNRKLCGSLEPFNRTLVGCKRLALQFFTDSSILKRGFEIQYKVFDYGFSTSSTTSSSSDSQIFVSETTPLPIDECGVSSKNFTDQIGEIKSPPMNRILNRNVSCTYTISAPQISTIRLSILALKFIRDCKNDWLSIGCLKDNSKEFHTYSLKLCSTNLVFQSTVVPSCSVLELRFHSISDKDKFRIRYNVTGVEDVCGRTSFTEQYGNITLPRPSSIYMTKFNCSYSVFSNNISVVSLNILSRTNGMAENDNCPDDWLLISCRDDASDKYYRVAHNCSTQSEMRLSLAFPDCRVVDIIFHTENIEKGRFFTISYAPDFHHIDSTSFAPEVSTEGKIICPKDCHFNWKENVCECVSTPESYMSSNQPVTTTEFFADHSKAEFFADKSKANFVGSKSFGVLIAFIVVLTIAALIIMTLILLRKCSRRLSKRREDEVTLVTEDSTIDDPDFQISTRFEGSSFLARFRQGPESSERYVPLTSLTSNRQIDSNEENADHRNGIEFSNEYQPDPHLEKNLI